jgi:hypothetical protein
VCNCISAHHLTRQARPGYTACCDGAAPGTGTSKAFRLSPPLRGALSKAAQHSLNDPRAALLKQLSCQRLRTPTLPARSAPRPRKHTRSPWTRERFVVGCGRRGVRETGGRHETHWQLHSSAASGLATEDLLRTVTRIGSRSACNASTPADAAIHTVQFSAPHGGTSRDCRPDWIRASRIGRLARISES